MKRSFLLLILLRQRFIAQKVNELAQKFKQMNINSVDIISYDVNTQN